MMFTAREHNRQAGQYRGEFQRGSCLMRGVSVPSLPIPCRALTRTERRDSAPLASVDETPCCLLPPSGEVQMSKSSSSAD